MKNEKSVVFTMRDFKKNVENKAKKANLFEYYYSGRSKGTGKTYLEYISRDEAAFKQNITASEYDQLMKLKIFNQEEYKQKIEVYKDRSKTTGIWNKNGLVDEDELKKIKNRLKTLNSEKQMIWDTVISFDKDFANENNINHPEKVHDALKIQVNELFKSKDIDPEDMEWFFAFHKNTDNPHIHLAFYEKRPTKKNDKYETKYIFNKKVFNSFRNNVAKNIEEQAIQRKVLLEESIRDNIVTSVKQNLKNKNNNFLNDKWVETQKIYKEISGDYKNILFELKSNQDNIKRKIGYWSLKPEMREKVDTITLMLFENDTELKSLLYRYEKNLKEYELYTRGSNDSNWVKNKLHGKDGLFSRVGNAVLNSMNQIDKIPKNKSRTKVEISIITTLSIRAKKMMSAMNKFIEREMKITKEILEKMKEGK